MTNLHVMKTCIKCGVEKEIELFVKRKSGYLNVCKDCDNARRRANRKNKKTAITATTEERMVDMVDMVVDGEYAETFADELQRRNSSSVETVATEHEEIIEATFTDEKTMTHWDKGIF